MNSCGCGSMPDMVTTSVQQLVVGDEGVGGGGGGGGVRIVMFLGCFSGR